jgi:CubicO group peptidase (beta-lactamase class C family)
LAACAVYACAQENPTRQIDEILAKWNKPDSPGAAVAVIRDGKIVFQKGYGRASLEYDAPISAETIFHVASVSKQFTAMCILLLEQDRKLKIDDDVHRYLPELPDYGSPVTIRNLLQHTSGIRDQWQALGLAGWRLDDVITQKQILRILFRQKELNFPPGSRHLYSNGGYSLLAEIVARVSGKPLPEFAADRIFQPLGMTRTHFHDDHQRIVAGRAYSYEPLRAGFQASPLNYANVGATSLFTTAPDLALWLDNFREPKIGRQVLPRFTEQAVIDGKKIDYALGVVVSEYRGLRTISHGGADAGYRSFVSWFPDQRMGVVVLSNLSNFNPGDIANRVAEVFAGSEMKPQPPPAPPVTRTFITLEPSAIGQFEGYYKMSTGNVVRVVKQGDKLMAAPPEIPPFEMKPTGPTQFYVAAMNADLEFTPKPGSAMALKVNRAGATVTGERFTFTPPDPNDLDAYPGPYWSEELETQYTIFLKDGKLFADHAHHGEIALTQVEKDRFSSQTWFMPEIRFERDASGRVVAVTLGGGRITGVRFLRR